MSSLSPKVKDFETHIFMPDITNQLSTIYWIMNNF